MPKAELGALLEQTTERVGEYLGPLSSGDLLEERSIHGIEQKVLSALMSSVIHLHGHGEQIVYLTRLRLGEAYRFDHTQPPPPPPPPQEVDGGA